MLLLISTKYSTFLLKSNPLFFKRKTFQQIDPHTMTTNSNMEDSQYEHGVYLFGY